MESNWRFNVWDLGESYSEFDLIASLVQPSPWAWVARLHNYPGGRYGAVRSVPGRGYSPYWDYFTVEPYMRFPWGLHVDPD